MQLQQYLPFTVLKPFQLGFVISFVIVATVLTVYGIETKYTFKISYLDLPVATVLTVYGIETVVTAINSHRHV